MKRTIRNIIGVLSLSLLSVCIWGSESKAEELKDENPERLEAVYGMDEEGNIFEVEDTPGIVEEGSENEVATYTLRKVESPKVVNFNTKGSATTNYTEYGTGASGYTCGAYGADAAYLGEENGKVIFMLSGVIGKVSKSEVQVVDLSKVKTVSYYVIEDGLLKHRIAHKVTETSYSSLVYGPAPSYLKKDVDYYSYDGHYFYDDYAVMLADYEDSTRENSLNPKEPYYNYYQFLPLRSLSNYTKADLNKLINAKVKSTSKMKNQGDNFVLYQNTYGVNALLMTGIGANESAWGASSICNSKNNLFGLDAVDDSPAESADVFPSIKECIRQFAETYMSKKYLRPGWTHYHGGFLGNKASGINVSYASDPYWGEKAANVAWTLDKNGGNKDYGVYTIGIKDTVATKKKANNVTVRSESNTSSTALYETGAWTSYAMILQKNKAENGFYKIQSDGVLDSGRTKVNTSSGKYDFEKMYAYISEEYISVIHKGDDVVFKELDKEDVEEDTKEPEITYTKYKTTTSVNYRSGAGTSYAKKGTLSKGTTIEVEDGYSKKANGYTWVRFKLNGKNYYVANQYIEKVITLSKPTLVSAKHSSGAVTVTWKKVTNAKGYYVYRKLSGGSWSKIGTVKSGSTVSYKDKSKLTAGKKYVYTVRAYHGDTLSGYNSGVSVEIPKAVTYTKAMVTSKVNYRSGAGTTYDKAGTLSQGATIQIENGYSKKANGYTWYRFKKNSKNYYVAAEYVKKISGDVKTPTLVSAKYSSGAITFTWKKVSGAKGYYVYRKVSGGSWSRIKVITSGSTVKYKDSSVKSGKKYIYTVRAYTADKVSNCNTKGVSATTKTTYTAYKTTSKVNYRTAAGLSKPKGGTFAKGKKISVEDGYSKKADGYTWYQFEMNGKNYYIVSSYLKKA